MTVGDAADPVETTPAPAAPLVLVPDRASPVEAARMPPDAHVLSWGYVGTGTHRAAGHVHAGVDLVAPRGTPVRAPERCIVEEVGRLPAPRGSGWHGYAPAVLLRGASGVWHLLAHLSGTAAGGFTDAPMVEPGAVLNLGDTVGFIGREGHAHWEVRTRPHATRTPEERRAHAERPTTFSITLNPRVWLAGASEVAPAGAFPAGPVVPPPDAPPPSGGAAHRRGNGAGVGLAILAGLVLFGDRRR